jgi:hypothetical protein
MTEDAMRVAIWAAVFAHYWCQGEDSEKARIRATEAVTDWEILGKPMPRHAAPVAGGPRSTP